jgi:hypothetical protein
LRVQTRTHNPVGASPTGANEASGPVAREAPGRESARAKPSDIILARRMCNAPGRNESERTCNLVTPTPVAETVISRRRQQATVVGGQRTLPLTGGVIAATWSEGLCGNWRDPRVPVGESSTKRPCL